MRDSQFNLQFHLFGCNTWYGPCTNFISANQTISKMKQLDAYPQRQAKTKFPYSTREHTSLTNSRKLGYLTLFLSSVAPNHPCIHRFSHSKLAKFAKLYHKILSPNYNMHRRPSKIETKAKVKEFQRMHNSNYIKMGNINLVS